MHVFFKKFLLSIAFAALYLSSNSVYARTGGGVVVYFILSRLLYLALSANLGLLCMPHPGMGPLV